jgi:hypothetical protein
VPAADRAEPTEAMAANQGDQAQGLADDRSEPGDQDPGGTEAPADPLAGLAAAIASLDRARLAGMLAADQGGTEGQAG